METSALAAITQYRLLILGDGTLRTVPLQGLRWVIGRAVDCTVALRDATVSRRHLLLERIGNEFCFQDLGQSNPVLLDGRVAHQGAIQVGQTLAIGMTRLTIERRNPTAQTIPDTGTTVVLSREVVDKDLPTPTTGSAFGCI